MVLGDDVSTLETFVWILNHVSRSITWFLFALKAWNVVKWLILTCSFIWWGQFIDWLQFETRPSSPLNFGMAYYWVWELALKSLLQPQSFARFNFSGGHFWYYRNAESIPSVSVLAGVWIFFHISHENLTCRSARFIEKHCLRSKGWPTYDRTCNKLNTREKQK